MMGAGGTAWASALRDACYRAYLEATADCGSRFVDDYDYNRCIDYAWRSYVRCLNGLPSKPFVP